MNLSRVVCIPMIVAIALATVGELVRAEDQQSGAFRVEATVAADLQAHGIGKQMADFPFEDVHGRTGRLSDLAEVRVIVIAVRDLNCPLSTRYAPRLQAMEQRRSDEPIAFLFLDPSEHDSAAAIAQDAADRGFRGRHIHDPRGELARPLGVTRTTDVLVLDADRVLRYRGAVDDQYGIGFTRPEPQRHYVRDAIDAVLAGRAPDVAATVAPGCVLTWNTGSGPAEITYHGRISRIVQSHCMSCHRPGGAAPFSLDSYAKVRGRRSMIRYVLDNRIMPPWHATEGVDGFANDRRLSEEDRRALFAWIDAGCPEGDPAEAPEPIDWPAPDAWAIGQPDLVYQIPHAYSIPAEGVVDYQIAYLKTDLDRDVWIKAVEIKPTSPQVVHHVLVFLEEPSDGGRRGGQSGLGGYFAGLVPGAGDTTYPTGYAKRLPKGAWLKFQLHYTVNGTATTDQTEIGFILADGPPEREIHTGAAAEVRFAIPPGAASQQVTAKKLLPPGTALHGFSPHMHLRGKAFRYELLYPDGRRTLLVDVPRFDFNWQTMYRLKEPFVIDTWAQLICTAWFDNSPENPANPDPSDTVYFGTQTWEEMMIGYFEWSKVR